MEGIPTDGLRRGRGPGRIATTVVVLVIVLIGLLGVASVQRGRAWEPERNLRRHFHWDGSGGFSIVRHAHCDWFFVGWQYWKLELDEPDVIERMVLASDLERWGEAPLSIKLGPCEPGWWRVPDGSRGSAHGLVLHDGNYRRYVWIDRERGVAFLRWGGG